MTERRRNNALTALGMQQLLQKKPSSYEALMKVSGLGRNSVEHWVRTMRRAGHAHVARYELDGRKRFSVPLFAWGPGEDADRPAPLRTNAQRQADYRERKKKEGAK